MAVVAVVIVALLIWGVNALLSSGKGDDSAQAVHSSSSLPTSIGGKPQLSGGDQQKDADFQDGADSSQEPSSEGSETSGAASASNSESGSKGTASAACNLDSLKVEAQTDTGDYQPGQLPVFHISITNPTKADCVIDTSKDSLRFEVYSMQDNSLLWVDTDCNDPVVSGEETFKAGATRVFEAQWSRTVSAPNQCSPGERTEVPSGSYYLHGVIGNNASAPVPFNLS